MYIHGHLYIYMNICKYIYAYTYVYVYIPIYVSLDGGQAGDVYMLEDDTYAYIGHLK